MEWFGFWLFMAAFVTVDHWVYLQGHNTLLLGHRTPEEKELQRLAIEERKMNIELKRRHAIGRRRMDYKNTTMSTKDDR